MKRNAYPIRVFFLLLLLALVIAEGSLRAQGMGSVYPRTPLKNVVVVIPI